MLSNYVITLTRFKELITILKKFMLNCSYISSMKQEFQYSVKLQLFDDSNNIQLINAVAALL